MRTIWHSLAWKEWHEHKWKLVAITAVLWGVAALVLCFDDLGDTFGQAIALVAICIVPLSVFVGLGAAANERSRNTLPFLQSLPVPMWQAALTKLLIGFATLFAPIVLTVGFLYVCRIGLGFAGVDYTSAVHFVEKNSLTGRWYFDCVLLSAPVAASFFIWAAAAGVNRKDEVSAGAVALAVMVGWYLLLVISGYLLYYPHAIPKWFFATAISTAPAGFLPLSDSMYFRFLPIGAGIAFFTHLALATWYVRRFGRVANLEIHSPQAAVRDRDASWLAIAPRRSAFTAIAWKQCRESGPLVLVGLAGLVGVVALLAVGESSELNYAWRPDQFAEMVAGVSVVVGFFVAIVVGIGVCLGDVEPGMNTFWRSRPIDADLWFWTKYLTGLLVLLSAMYGPLLVTLFALHPDPGDEFFRHNFAIMPVAHIAIFAAAVMTTCLVRHAVYAAILSMAVVYLGTLAGVGLWFLAGLLHLAPLNSVHWWEPTEAQVAFGMALSFITSTIIAWLATRYDWGRKSRY